MSCPTLSARRGILFFYTKVVFSISYLFHSRNLLPYPNRPYYFPSLFPHSSYSASKTLFSFPFSAILSTLPIPISPLTFLALIPTDPLSWPKNASHALALYAFLIKSHPPTVWRIFSCPAITEGFISGVF